jgi:uroporphyrinogen decarboxylase
MTSRERVIKALNHQKTDRVPIDLGGAASNLNDGVYFRLKEYLKISGDIEPFRHNTTSNYYDVRILDRIGIYFRRVYMRQINRDIYSKDKPYYKNEWGVTHYWDGKYCNPIDAPLKNAGREEIETYNWPKASEIYDAGMIENEARRLYENTDYAVVARMPCWGLFDIAHQLRGMEQFLMDMVEEPDTARLIVEKVLECVMDIYGMMLDALGKYVQIVETCDDMGSQNSQIFSCATYREILKPSRTKLNELVHQKAPEAKIFFHCCGAIANLIPDIIESGVDILNPLQPNAVGMDPGILKEKYGDKLCFHGCIDTQKALRGTVSDTREEVKLKINILAKNGGYILAPANHIMSDVPLENVLAMYETAKNYEG